MYQHEEIRRITEEMTAQFAEKLRRAEYSEGTISNYVRSIRAFAVWNGDDPVSHQRAAAWKAHLTANHAPATVNAMLAGINQFFAAQGWMDCRLKPLRLQRRSFQDPNRELSRTEYRRLVQTARTLGRERLALLMETICATGIRVSEVSYITVEAARAGLASIALKGKIRTILIPGKLCRRLLKFARANGTTSGPVFRTASGRPLPRTRIWAEMKQLCRAAGVAAGKVFPHNLRHLFARAFYAVCRDVVKLADILGHSSIDTTRIYLRSTGAEHLRQMERTGLLC